MSLLVRAVLPLTAAMVTNPTMWGPGTRHSPTRRRPRVKRLTALEPHRMSCGPRRGVSSRLLLDSPEGASAINDDRLADDVSRRLRREKDDRGGEFAWITLPTGRNAGQLLFE